MATPMQITATRRHVDFHIWPVVCHGHPWREDPAVGSKGIQRRRLDLAQMAGPYCPTPTSGKRTTDGVSEQPNGISSKPKRRESSQPARFRGMGPKIRRELGRGDIAEGLLFFLGRGLWWW